MPKRKLERTSSGKLVCNKQMKPLKLEYNPEMSHQMDDITKNWRENKPYLHPQENGSIIQVLNYPFKVCRINNFFRDGQVFLEDLKDELDNLMYKERNKDLYHYNQSQDLKRAEGFNIGQFRNFMYSDLRQWLMNITGFPLTDTMDLTCSRYEHTDFLLCHDDQCDSRKIAFIMYLCRNWQEADGGALDLFDTDDFGQPNKVVHSFTPSWNSLVFFEVSKVSFHQVAEVLTEDRFRITIGGWFHVRENEHFPYDIGSPRYLQPVAALQSELNLADWVSARYLNPTCQRDINAVMECKSEIGLFEFLVPEKLQELTAALNNAELTWKLVGPANQRRYEVLEQTPVAGTSTVIWEFLQLMQSNLMFELLFKFSELNLIDAGSGDAMEEDSLAAHALAHVELQRWTPGCYTALHDTEVPIPMLETILFLGYKQHSEEAGGAVIFLDQINGVPLTTCDPSTANCFTMVYRDNKTACFTRYLNSRQLTPYYVLRGSYIEKQDRLY